MPVRNDHEIKFMGDATLYLALKSLAEADDRSFGSYLRHVLRGHVRNELSAQERRVSTPNSGQVFAGSCPNKGADDGSR